MGKEKFYFGLTVPRGGTWTSNIWGGAAGKSGKAPCRGVKIPENDTLYRSKIAKTLPYLEISSNKFVCCHANLSQVYHKMR